MKAAVWLAVSGEDAAPALEADLVPGVGQTLSFALRKGGEPERLLQLLWADRHAEARLQVVLEPAVTVPLVEGAPVVSLDQLEAAFDKWAKADVDPALPAVRHLAWTVWRAAYYWSAILQREGLNSAMAALDPPAARLP